MRLFIILISLIVQSACLSENETTSKPTHTPVEKTEPDHDRIYAFIGRKIDAVKDDNLTTVTETVMKDGEKFEVERKVMRSLDEKMTATYEVVASMNEPPDDNIVTFVSYDHWGEFGFRNYDHALLILGKSEEGYFHYKYQYDTVFKTLDGRWAACGDIPLDLKRDKVPSIEPQIIPFGPGASFGPDDLPPSRVNAYDKQALEEYWNSSVFERKENKWVCKKGIYATDLFKLRMDLLLEP